MIYHYYYHFFKKNPPKIILNCCHGSVKIAHDLENNSSPTSEKTEQVARAPTGRSRVCQGDKQQHVTPGTGTTHASQEWDAERKCCRRTGSHTLGRGARTRGHPLGRASSQKTGHREVQENRARPRTHGKGRQGSHFPPKCGAASRSEKPNTQSIGWLEQPHYN